MIKTDPGFTRGCNEPTDEQRRRTRLLVCSHAQDAADAALLLNILGLLPGPRPTAPGCQP